MLLSCQVTRRSQQKYQRLFATTSTATPKTPRRPPIGDSFKVKLPTPGKQAGFDKQYFKLPHLRPRTFHVTAFVASSVISVLAGSLWAMSSPFGAQGIIEFFDEQMALIYEDKNEPKLEFALKKLANCTWSNDTLKHMIMTSKLDMNRLFEIIFNSSLSLACRNYAVKTIDNITQLKETQDIAFEQNYHEKLISLLSLPSCPLYMTKTASFALTNLGSQEKHYPELVRAGALLALQRVQSNSHTRRERTQELLMRLSEYAFSHPLVLLGLSAEERQLVETLHEQALQQSKTFFYPVKATLVEYGAYLYLHTVAGGALWGALTSVYKKVDAPTFARNVFRTAFITGVIPAYFVGLSVSIFQYYQKQCDYPVQLTWLATTASFVTILPWIYLLPLVEVWSPLWLGGHIVGFGTFFASLLASNSDLLRSDALLQYQDQQEQQQQQKQQQKKG